MSARCYFRGLKRTGGEVTTHEVLLLFPASYPVGTGGCFAGGKFSGA
jgi:hypothetical protein